jgi:hypothetical protein
MIRPLASAALVILVTGTSAAQTPVATQAGHVAAALDTALKLIKSR